jgi:hypothetical protein
MTATATTTPMEEERLGVNERSISVPLSDWDFWHLDEAARERRVGIAAATQALEVARTGRTGGTGGSRARHPRG